MYIPDWDTTISLSSIFALSPKVIALPLPTLSKNFHLRLGSVVGVKEGRTGRHILGIGDSTTHLFLTNSPVLLIVITVVQFQLLFCKTNVYETNVWLPGLILVNSPAQPVEKIRLSLSAVALVALGS